MVNMMNLQLTVSYRAFVRLDYRTTLLYPSADEFYRTILTRGLKILNEERQRGEERESPLRIPPFPEDEFDYAGIGVKPEDTKILELGVDEATMNAFLDYLRSSGEESPNYQPLPQQISEKILLKGVDDLGWEAWEEAEKHER